MLIHLGGDTGVWQKSIVAIIDMDTPHLAPSTNAVITKARKEGRVVNVTEDAPKSCIITTNKEGILLYLSPITPRTLLHRVDSGQEMRLIQNGLDAIFQLK